MLYINKNDKEIFFLLNNIIKNNKGIFNNKEEKEKIYAFANKENNREIKKEFEDQNIIDFDYLFNQIIYIDAGDTAFIFLIDIKGIVKGFTKNKVKNTLILKWEREEFNEYYNIIFCIELEQLKNFIGNPTSVIESYFKCIQNNLTKSFKNKIQIRLKHSNKEFIFDINEYILGHHIDLYDCNTKECVYNTIIDEIFKEEHFQEIYKLF